VLWKSVTGGHPSEFKDKPDSANRPVEEVSWCDAVLFANRLSGSEGLTLAYQIPKGFKLGMDGYDSKRMSHEVTVDLDADGYRLPTEAEWEYAARAGEEYIIVQGGRKNGCSLDADDRLDRSLLACDRSS